MDVVVLAVVGLAALRGYFRGFFRELFGFLALFAAVFAAFRWGSDLGEWLLEFAPAPGLLGDALGFVGVFLGTHLAVNLLGLVLDRLAAALLLGGVNRFVGAVFGAGKAAFAAAFVLLFLHMFVPAKEFDDRLMASKVGKPLVEAAEVLLEFGLSSVGKPPGERRS